MWLDAYYCDVVVIMTWSVPLWLLLGLPGPLECAQSQNWRLLHVSFCDIPLFNRLCLHFPISLSLLPLPSLPLYPSSQCLSPPSFAVHPFPMHHPLFSPSSPSSLSFSSLPTLHRLFLSILIVSLSSLFPPFTPSLPQMFRCNRWKVQEKADAKVQEARKNMELEYMQRAAEEMEIHAKKFEHFYQRYNNHLESLEVSCKLGMWVTAAFN